MRLKRANEFREDAVRIEFTGQLTRKQVADDLCVGMSTVNKWTQRIETRMWFRKRI